MGNEKRKRNARPRFGRAAMLVTLAACVVAVAFAVFAVPSGPAASNGAGLGIREIAAEDVPPDAFATQAPTSVSTTVSGSASNEAPSSLQGLPGSSAAPSSAEGEGGDVEIEGEYEPDVVLVQLPSNWTAEELSDVLGQSACVREAVVSDEDLQRGFAALPLAEGYDVAQALSELEQLPAVVDAQPNYLYTLADDGLDDLTAGVAFGFDGTNGSGLVPAIVSQATAINDARKAEQWALDSVHAYDAWDIVKAGSAGNGRVSVAVLDNGCFVAHEDLAANIVASYNAVSSSNAYQTSDVTPRYGGHGTHVCGIISAVANNNKGVAGVSYNAGLVPIQVFEKSANSEAIASTESLCAAYDYVIANADAYNIKVVNMSLGGATNADADLDYYDKALQRKVNSAYAAGILTVCSAGNEAEENNGAYFNFPSDWLDKALGVIALKSGTPPTRGSYSNYNVSGQTTKDISAPGSSVLSTYSDSASSYATLSGTSMASPYVAGIAALVYAADPDLSAADVAGILCSTATDLGASGWDEEYGAGEVNAKAAAQAAANAYLIGHAELLKGGTTTLTPSKGTGWSWSSSNAKVATVSNGVVTGVAGGTAVITATSGTMSASKTVTVYDISFSGTSEVNAGSTVKLTFNESPNTELWYVESANTKIAQLVDSDAGDGDEIVAVQGVSAGTTKITATSASNPSLVVDFPITVIDLLGDAAVLAGSTVALEPSVEDAWQWSSSNTGVATVSDTGVVTGVSAGSATITATSLTRSLSKTITVYEASLDGDDEMKAGSSITLAFAANPSDATWTFSSSNTGLASVADNGDGTVTVAGLSAGSVDVMATLDGVEGVSVTHGITVLESDAQFSLRENRVSVSWPDYSDSYYYYSGQAKTPEPIVTYASGTGWRATRAVLTKDKDYILTYDKNVTAGTAYVRVTGTGDYKDTLSYTFTIKPYPLEGAYSTRFFFFRTTIVPAVSYSGLASSVVYTGRAQTPTPLLFISTEGTYVLEEGSDYTLTYSDNTNVGTATVAVTGQGNFSGSGTISFAIKPASLSDATVTATGWTWDGAMHDPQVGVKLGGVLVAQDGNWSYAVTRDGRSYATSTVLDPGTYTITVTGQGNYTDSASATFVVAQSTEYESQSETLAPGGGADSDAGRDSDFGSAVDSGSGTGGDSSGGSGQGASAGADTGSSQNMPASPGSTALKQAMFRLYNPYTGEHFYTASITECNEVILAGWSYEGIGWTAPSTGDPVYRLYNSYAGDHHYTLSAAERDELIAAGWTDEGVGWCSDPNRAVPLYREYNPNMFSCNHNYTSDPVEHAYLVSLGWADEGIAWYGAQ